MSKARRYAATAFVFVATMVVPTLARAATHLHPKRWGLPHP